MNSFTFHLNKFNPVGKREEESEEEEDDILFDPSSGKGQFIMTRSCQMCHIHHKKCAGGRPCQRCRIKGYECINVVKKQKSRKKTSPTCVNVPADNVQPVTHSSSSTSSTSPRQSLYNATGENMEEHKQCSTRQQGFQQHSVLCKEPNRTSISPNVLCKEPNRTSISPKDKASSPLNRLYQSSVHNSTRYTPYQIDQLKEVQPLYSEMFDLMNSSYKKLQDKKTFSEDET